MQTTPGGLAGNEDSGALSSWYVWSAIGLFPVCSQPVLLLGAPLYQKSTIQLKNATFTLEIMNPELDSPYISEVTLNGKKLHRAWLHHKEFYSGGHLQIVRSATPTAFGSEVLPPSYKI